MNHPMPTEGGRYIRDPETGALTRVDETGTPAEPSAEAPGETAPAPPDPVTEVPPRGKKRI